MKVYNMVASKNLYLFWQRIWKIDKVIDSKSTNATIFKLIKTSENRHGKFTPDYSEFLSCSLIESKMQRHFTPTTLKILAYASWKSKWPAIKQTNDFSPLNFL